MARACHWYDSPVRMMWTVGAPTGEAVVELLEPLRAALAGSGPPLLPVPDGAERERLLRAARPDHPVADDVALLLPTSGSTGDARVVELTGTALRASARATHDRLGGPGQWLLALPVTHVAGWQVLVRSADAGHRPAVLDLSGGFSPAAFTAAAARLTAPRRYASLVPTQVHRLLDDPAATDALRRLDAVLVGGAATPPTLARRAAGAGVRLVATYGMTETCGGCVYDGRPLDGVRAATDAGGRLLLAGAVLARGYRGPAATAAAFVERDGERWFTTSDLGEVRDGVVRVDGRLDDVVVTGGRKVAPAAVEAVVAALPGVRECVVVGVPDAEWGQAVTALVVGDPGPPDVVRRTVAERLGRVHAPRHVLVVDALPLRGVGKPDRVAAADLASRLLRGDG
ncbi:MAG: o-succinylbenzoate--CoA ligase [Actinomycetes bacterium]